MRSLGVAARVLPWLVLGCATAGPRGRLPEESAAAEAMRLGMTDVAAARLGEAFVRRPSRARLDAWVDALRAGGEVRRAHEDLAAARLRVEPRWRDQLVLRMAGLPPFNERPIEVALLTPGLSDFYAAAADGRWRAAADAFAATASDAPYHLAYAGEVLARLGDEVEARRMWSAARAGFYDRGATLQLVPVDLWRPVALAWRGEAPVSLTRAGLIGEEHGREVGMLRGALPLYVAGVGEQLAFTADGRDVLVVEGEALVRRDALSGALRRPLARVGDRPGEILTSGTGGESVTLIVEQSVTLLDDRGRKVAEFELPLASRPEAVAMTPGATLVALGGHDGGIRVYDRVRGEDRMLTRAWLLSEQMNAGVRALGFAGEDRLIAVYGHGDIVVWDPKGGQELAYQFGECEVEPMSVYCPKVDPAIISSDGASVVYVSEGEVRERSVVTGAVVRRARPARTPVVGAAHPNSGAVALVDGDAAMRVWRPGADEPALGPAFHGQDAYTYEAWLSRDGRVLCSPKGKYGHVTAWDLATGRRLPVTRGAEDIVAMRADGRRFVVLAREAIEVRDDDGRTVFAELFDAGTYRKRRRREIGAFLPDSGDVVLDLMDRWVLVDPKGRRREVASSEEIRAVSEDGRWLAVGARGSELTVRRMAAVDEVVHALGRDAMEVAFSRDGARIAWSYTVDNARFRVETHALVGPHSPRTLRLSAWSHGLTFNADGSEVWSLVDRTWLQWSFAREDLAEVQLPGSPGPESIRRVQPGVDGRTFHVLVRGGVQVLVDAIRPRTVGELRVLSTGEWLALATSGAIDGSARAIEEVVTWVELGPTKLTFSGRLAWDAAHVAGLAGRIVAGEDPGTPVRLRGAGSQ